MLIKTNIATQDKEFSMKCCTNLHQSTSLFTQGRKQLLVYCTICGSVWQSSKTEANNLIACFHQTQCSECPKKFSLDRASPTRISLSAFLPSLFFMPIFLVGTWSPGTYPDLLKISQKVSSRGLSFSFRFVSLLDDCMTSYSPPLMYTLFLWDILPNEFGKVDVSLGGTVLAAIRKFY